MKSADLKNCRITEGFFAERQRINAEVTLGAVYDRFSETGRIGALKCDPTRPKSHVFWDSDVVKWLEGAAYSLCRREDETLRSRYEEIVSDIERNQLENGYFNSYFQVFEPDAIFTDRTKHELYCAGHLFEAAVAAKKYLNDDRLLRVSEKYVDYIIERFMVKGDAAFTTPGHEEIELALMRLYDLTKDEKYFRLSAFFLNRRGVADEADLEENRDYNQSHLPIREQKDAVGHAVRALYLYSGMADLALHTGEAELISTLESLGEDVITRKMYVTGGVGSSYSGENFTVPFDLPNESAYAETCASIALAFFCDRMFRLTQKKRYADALERAIYNGILSGVSLEGDSFFYINPLELPLAKNLYGRTQKGHRRVRQPLAERVQVFSCSCCPPNICRFMEELPAFIWYTEGNTAVLSQYISSVFETETVSAVLQSDFPYSGRVTLTVDSHGRDITLKLRKPAWCDRAFANESDGFLIYNGVFSGEEISLDFGMKAVRNHADPRVWYDAGKVAFIYGPLVLCAEGVDNGGSISALFAKRSGAVKVSVRAGDPAVLSATVPAARMVSDGALYSAQKPTFEEAELKLIPYFAWANRGESDMKVWIPER